MGQEYETVTTFFRSYMFRQTYKRNLNVLRNSSQQAKRALTDIYKARKDTEVIINKQNYNYYTLTTLLPSV